MALTDEEFTKKLLASPTLLKKIQLAIREERYSIWVRNPPNFPSEYLNAVLNLPDNARVVRKSPRLSGGSGLNYVAVLKFNYCEMGRSVQVYLKGFFAQDKNGRMIVSLTIQSLKEDSEEI